MGTSTDRVVVISGASGKLGGVVAARFAEAGYRLALLARAKDDVADLAASLPGGVGRHVPVAVDLGSAESSAAAAAVVRQELGAASVLLQLVGGYAGGRPFVENDDEEL